MIRRERLESVCRRCVTVLSNTHQHRRHLFYIVVLLFFSILLLLPAFFHQGDAKDKKTREAVETLDYRSALAANLKRLRQMQAQHSAPEFKPRVALKTTSRQRKSSKAYEVRQHAPTRMYITGSMPNTVPSSKGNASLLDKSGYAHFVNQTSSVPIVIATRIAHPFYTIPQGEFIHAILETAIDSDLPGMIRAVIARPVYSYQGDRLLIPTGSRLIGQYSSQTLQGINRMMVVWQRIILPNGISVQIDSPGSDALGEGGFGADQVNRHFFQRFGQASLLSLIGAVVSNNNPTQQYQTAIAQSFQSSASRTLEHTIAIKPILRVNQGDKVIVFVARDLDFYSTKSSQNDK